MEIKMDIWYKILNIVALLLVPIVAVIVGQKLQERAKKSANIQSFDDKQRTWLESGYGMGIEYNRKK